MSKENRFRYIDHGYGTRLDDALAELGGDESPEAEAARTVRRMSTDATSREFQVRLKRE